MTWEALKNDDHNSRFQIKIRVLTLTSHLLNALIDQNRGQSYEKITTTGLGQVTSQET